jgi:predicted alpha/beta-fold hydrolase
MNLSRLYGHASTTFYSHSSPLALTTKDGKTVSLLDICKDSTPPCYLNPFLFNGHLQTIYTAIKWSDIPIYYKRRIFEATLPEVSGIFAVDFVVPPYAAPVDETLPPRTTYYTPEEFDNIGSDDEKPMLITLHGLSGGSHEIYLRSVLDPLFRAGWAACVVNSRGCAMSKISSGVLYNARATWDVRQVVTWAREKWPRRKLFGIGFSLGANILTNVRRADSVMSPFMPFIPLRSRV